MAQWLRSRPENERPGVQSTTGPDFFTLQILCVSVYLCLIKTDCKILLNHAILTLFKVLISECSHLGPIRSLNSLSFEDYITALECQPALAGSDDDEKQNALRVS